MKLHSIRIADYRVLHNFELTFEGTPADQTYALDLIVGVNGTGKSTLLRALAAIFRYLERKEMPPFAFEVSYELQGGSGATTLSNLKEKSFEKVENGLLRVSYGLPQNQPSPDKPIALERLESSELPPLAVAFTTGSEREWELNDTGLPVHDKERQKPPNPDDAQFKVSFNVIHGAFVSENLPMIGLKSALKRFLSSISRS